MIPSIALTGIGVITPYFDDIGTMASYCATASVPDKKEIAQVNLPGDIKLQDQRRMAKVSRLALYAANKAMIAAQAKGKDAALFVGLTHSSGSLLKEFHDYLFDYGPDMASPNAFSNGVTGAALGVVSKYLGLTLGGATFVGYEKCGLDILAAAAQAINDGRFPICCAGATEEYSPVVAQAYEKLGWYHGPVPAMLPCPMPGAQGGFTMADAAAFVVCEPAHAKAGASCCFYTPVEDLKLFDNSVDAIISGAGGGPQDQHELKILAEILSQQKNPVPLLFPKCFFGETAAAGSLLSIAMGWDMLMRNASYPSYPIHADLASKICPVTSPAALNSLLILSTSRTGDVSMGILSRNPRA
jgi:3-oxoacyl-(acyl-carrier-protein) synthase